MDIEGQLYLSGRHQVVRQFSNKKKITHIIGTDLSLERLAIQRGKTQYKKVEERLSPELQKRIQV